MSLLVTDTDREREQDKWMIAREALLGSQRNFAVTAVLLPNIADIGFQPLHPTSLALMPPPAAPAVDRRETSHVDERGDHKAEEHEEQASQEREAKKARGARGVRRQQWY